MELFNRTLLDMLGTLEDRDKYQWCNFVKPLGQVYNYTQNDTTGYSRYELLFGRQPRLPIDLLLRTYPDKGNHQTHSEYVKGLRQCLQESYSLAARRSQEMGDKNKARFDKNMRAAEIFEGDRVLVRNVNIRGKHKLANRWEKKINVIVKWIRDCPLYVVKPETGEGPHRTLHRDLLLPCGFFPVGQINEHSPHSYVPRKMRLRYKKTTDTQENTDDQGDELYSDENELYPSLQVPEIITRGPFIQRQEIVTPVIFCSLQSN